MRGRPRPQRVAAVVVFGALSAVGFLPLFGGPGYEQSLASGLVVPSAAAIATALDVSVSVEAPLACFGRGLACGAGLAAVAFATALLHGLRVGLCDLWGGALLFVLTAGAGGVMGGAWGAVVGEACRGRAARRSSCVALALAAPLAGIAVSLGRFWGSPMIFAYDPFFGFFSGTLYDTIVDVRTELWSYRAGSMTTLAGVALVASALGRTPRGTPAMRSARADLPAAARLLLGLVLLSGSVAVTVFGAELGHWQTSASIARALGGRAAGPRCDVVYPDSLASSQAALLVRDCEEDLAADEKRLGARLEGRLTAFFFRDVNEKRQLTGAAHTSIAKPWRREVYVQLAPYPHPILGHEIAHVVSGSFGRGPFRIAGRAGGLWPNPGLIEGVAVATSPDDDELTDAQWARAMLDLGALPPVARLFSVDFLGENAAKSYTIAGAFVAWVLERWGAPIVRAWYGGGSIEALTGQGWPALDDQFRRSLRALAMPGEASAYATAKFERPSVWERRCPHVVDALKRDADTCRDDHRFARASELYAGALARDPHDWYARLERARIDVWFGDDAGMARGRGDLEAIAGDPRAPRTWRDRAEEALADDDLTRGSGARAAGAYRALEARTLDEDAARTLEVKAESTEGPLAGPARRAIVDLLIGEPGRSPDPWLGAFSLGTWAVEAQQATPSYLVGKNLAMHGDYARAAVWLDRALDSASRASDAGPMAPPIARELLRQRAICACVLRDDAALADVTRRVLAPTSPFAHGPGDGRKEWLLGFAARCGSAPGGSW
jgi:hypothetical protein